MKWNDKLDPACITLAEVLNKSNPVTLVYHEAGHGGWSFLDDYELGNRAPEVVPKEIILEIDPTLKEITDLEVGFLAHRKFVGAPWTREKI